MLFIVGVEDIFWHFFARLWTLDQPSVWRVGLTLNIFTCDEIGCDPFKQKWTQMHYLKIRWTLQSSKLTAHWTPILHCAQNHNWTTSGPNILARSIFKVGFRWSSLTQNMKESQLFSGKISAWHVRESSVATLLPKKSGLTWWTQLRWYCMPCNYTTWSATESKKLMSLSSCHFSFQSCTVLWCRS